MVTSADVRGNGYLYIGSVRYELEGAKPAFESAPFAMGRIGRLGEEYDTRYFLNDHLGSVRAIVNQNGVVTAEYDYMPYGMQHKNSSLATSDTNEFRYNGKELQSRFCVDLYDSQARLQGMNARFNSIDPRAEEMTDISPYAYCADNPINRIDYDGEYPILLPLIKGAVGAVVDATAQVSVAMADDQGFFEALSNIDYTSIGASFMTSALLSPGMSTAAKVTTASVIAVDVAVDYSDNKGLEYIGEGKTPGKAALDAAASLVPGKVARGVTSGLEKAIVSDLSSKASATLSKEIKSSLMQMQTIFNSDGFQIGTNVIANFTAGLINGQLSAIPFGGMKQTSMPQTHEIIRADALQVYKPEYKIKVK